MVIWGLLFLLNEAPLELRKVPILRNLLEVMALFGAGLAGFAAFGGPMIGFPKEWMMVLLGTTALGSIAFDAFRQGDSIVLWYRDWLSGWQRWFFRPLSPREFSHLDRPGNLPAHGQGYGQYAAQPVAAGTETSRATGGSGGSEPVFRQ